MGHSFDLEFGNSSIDRLDSLQRTLKIIANSSSYGIFVQVDTEYKEGASVEVFGLDQFEVQKDKVEKPGLVFHPIMGVLITSGARLILAMTERILMDHGETYAFCDTDIMAVPIHLEKTIQDRFRDLNPYSFDSVFFKVEDENYDPITHERRPLWFYGISAKRYVLYNIEDGKPVIRKHSSHGLGHLLNPIPNDPKWEETLWQDILHLHHHPKNREDIIDRYRGRYAVSRMTISTPDLMIRMKALNARRAYQNRIKPGNFVLIGTAVMVDEETGEAVKTMVPFSTKPWEAPYSEFVDYHSGKILRGKEYWKSMDQIFLDYVNHPESKFEGDVGVLSRRHIHATSFIHIGKEANRIDEAMVLGLQEGDVEVYDQRGQDRKRIKQDPFSVSYREAELAGVSRSTLKRWRKKMTEMIT